MAQCSHPLLQSGRVLKVNAFVLHGLCYTVLTIPPLQDEDVLSVYKIQSSHTIHMVKGASRSAGPSQSAPQPLPSMQTGQNPNDPLTQLNGSRAFGAMAGFNPFAQMGLNPNDPNMVCSRLQ